MHRSQSSFAPDPTVGNVFINTKLMTDKAHAAALDAQADALLSEYVPKADAVFAQVTKQLRT